MKPSLRALRSSQTVTSAAPCRRAKAKTLAPGAGIGPGFAAGRRDGGNSGEIGQILRRRLERPASPGHGEIGGANEKPIDGIEARDGLDIGQRTGSFDHRIAEGAPVLRLEEARPRPAIAHGAAIAHAARAPRRVFGQSRCLPGMSEVGDLGQDHAVDAGIQGMLDVDAVGRGDPRKGGETQTLAGESEVIRLPRRDDAMLMVEDDGVIADQGCDLAGRQAGIFQPEGDGGAAFCAGPSLRASPLRAHGDGDVLALDTQRLGPAEEDRQRAHFLRLQITFLRQAFRDLGAIFIDGDVQPGDLDLHA